MAEFKYEEHTRKGWQDGYILVDFDRTLATYTGWTTQGPNLGSPIPAMVERVKRWLSQGREVRIFTARASRNNPRLGQDIIAIQAWCREHVGMVLSVTNEKDFKCAAIWDDIAVSLEPNTGACITSNPALGDPIAS